MIGKKKKKIDKETKPPKVDKAEVKVEKKNPFSPGTASYGEWFAKNK